MTQRKQRQRDIAKDYLFIVKYIPNPTIEDLSKCNAKMLKKLKKAFNIKPGSEHETDYKNGRL